MPHRCAFGCKSTGVVLHVFPDPEKFPVRFRVWVTLVGGKLESPTDYEFYRKKQRICDIHFTDEHRNRFNRLNALAIPTLNLSVGTHQSESHGRQPAAAAAPVAAGSSQSDTSVPAPVVTGIFGTHQSDVFHEREPAASDAASIPAPVATETPGTQHFDNVDVTSNNITTAASSVLAEHTYSVMCRAKRKTSNDDVRVNIQKTPHYRCNSSQLMRKKKRYLQSEINRLRKREISYKQRLENATKMSYNTAFQTVVKNMTKPARLLVQMQKQSAKKPKGRRYSIQEKILALSLYKNSPKCYRLLCEYFSLPSSKAMKRLLCQVKLTPGINKVIFNKIKKTMAEKAVSDQIQTSAIAEHLLTSGTNHWIELHKPKILSTEQHYYPRMVREAIEIKKHPKNFNRDDGFGLSHTWGPVIQKLKPREISSNLCADIVSVVCSTGDNN